MASPAAAATAAAVAPQVNGFAAVAALSRPESPASINSKRKRDPSDDGEPELELNGTNNRDGPAVNGLHKIRDPKSLIHDFYDVLQSLDTSSPGILKRPLSGSDAAGDEPSAKRAKSEEDGKKPATIADKMMQDTYEALDDLVTDTAHAVDAHIKELESNRSDNDPIANDEAIAKAVTFKSKALGLYRRELAYPNVPPSAGSKADLRDALPPSATGGIVLTTVGAAPTLKPLFTSLQQTTTADGVRKPIPDGALPNGVATTNILSDLPPAAADKTGRPLTLGELFPSPRNLPPLQPPKAPKNTTKNNVLTFYHPELTEKSKFRSETYFSQNIATGQWLDYSNAGPITHTKTKQRERAQSLAGHKPSSTELEMSEMEALFRGAFSSFAPCKDDSAAIVPSNQVSRIWWQRVGRRNFEKLVESDSLDENEDGGVVDSTTAMEVDEERVKNAINNWDESNIDPSLDEVMGKKSDEDKEVDDLLDEVSDLIETLASYQRNRNLTLPTSQDRYSTDPVNGDMLRNGSISHQPSEEELLTYQALKAQLTLIINTLPPYAVARLNSDKLEELCVSTKIEVRTDEYKGVMEEDEPARLARQAAQTAANASQRQPTRVPSISSPTPYSNHQYQNQFVSGARVIPNTHQFPATPVRAQAPNMYQRAPSSVPLPPQPHHQPQQRAPQTQYRPNNYGYAPQLAKAQTPYGHSNMPQYATTPTQPRMQPQPSYNIAPQGVNPNHRYPPNYPTGYPQQQPPPPPQHQQMHPQHNQLPQHLHHPQQHPQHMQHPPQSQHSHPQHPQHQQHPSQHAPMPQHLQHVQPHSPQAGGFSPYTNGGQMPRAMPPQTHQYSQATPPQQHQQIARPPYGGPGQGMPPNSVQRQYNGSPGAGMMPGGGRPPNLTGYATVMPEVQQRQLMEQARARADAEQRVSGHMGKVTQGEVVGLAGIGLGGNVDVHKIAAAKAMQMGNNAMSPGGGVKMNMHGGPSPINGGVGGIAPPTPTRIAAAMSQGSSASPVPVPGPGQGQGQGFKPPV